MTEPRRLVAVDPGDRWTGVAFFEETPDAEHGWECVDAIEFDPDEFEDSLAESIVAGDVDFLIYERFRLYGDKAKQQKGSEFRTTQSIGVFKWLVRNHNRHAAAHGTIDRKGGGLLTCEQPGGVCHDPKRRPTVKHVVIFGQMADIKKPTRAILNRKKIKSVAGPIAKAEYEGRDHVKDAELHGWKYILDEMHKTEQE